MKYDVENVKKLTKDLRRRDDPGFLLLTSDDSESLTRIRSVAFQALRMCALKSQYDNGVLRITAGDAYPTVDDNGKFHFTVGKSYQTIDPPHLVWIDMLDGEALSSDLAGRINAAKSGSGSTGRLLLTCGRAHLQSATLTEIEPWIHLGGHAAGKDDAAAVNIKGEGDASNGAVNVKVSHLYEEIKLKLVGGDESWKVKDMCGDPALICEMLTKHLKCPVPVERLFFDDDTRSLMVQLHVTDVGFLQSLNQIFLGASVKVVHELSKDLGLEAGVRLELDMTHFAQKFESIMLHLENLTQHQEEKFEGMTDILLTPGGRADIRAPAGAGKTYLGLKALVDVLLDADDTDQRVTAFVSRNEALCLHVTKWLYMRLRMKLADADAIKRLEARFVVMHAPFDGLHGVHIEETRVAVGEKRDTALDLVVVDEAHHLHADGNLETIIEQYVEKGSTKLILLSDASQSGATEMAERFDTKEVRLSEIVRSTQTIVAMGAMFAKTDLGVVASHAAEGPPACSFLFDLDSQDQKFEQYAEVLATKAVRKLLKQYPGMSLDNRVIIIGPNEDFCSDLKPHLQKQLEQELEGRMSEGQEVKIVDASEASAALPTSRLSKEVRFVLTPIHAADGLERLVAIGVGIDKPASGGVDDKTRSAIYRAVTRGQMQAMVVNENVENGYFSFLNRIELDRSTELDQEQEKRDRVEKSRKKVERDLQEQLNKESLSITKLASTIGSARMFREDSNMLDLIQAAEKKLAPLVLEGLKGGVEKKDETILEEAISAAEGVPIEELPTIELQVAQSCLRILREAAALKALEVAVCDQG